MKTSERWVIAGVLAIIIVMVGTDLLNDTGEGVSTWHVMAEGIAGLAAALGIVYLLRGTFSLQQRLSAEVARSTALREETGHWRADARRHVEGLTRWNLTVAEKEVTFLLLNGLGFKEIAAVRETTEKTARAQSTAIYAKAGLSGRTELAAFFLEDLLVPKGG